MNQNAPWPESFGCNKVRVTCTGSLWLIDKVLGHNLVARLTAYSSVQVTRAPAPPQLAAVSSGKLEKHQEDSS